MHQRTVNGVRRGSTLGWNSVAMYSVQVRSRARHRDPGPLEDPGGRIRRRADAVLVGGGCMGHRPLDPLCASSAPEDFQRAVVGYSGFQRVCLFQLPGYLWYVGLEPPATASHGPSPPLPMPLAVVRVDLQEMDEQRRTPPERAMLPLRS